MKWIHTVDQLDTFHLNRHLSRVQLSVVCGFDTSSQEESSNTSSDTRDAHQTARVCIDEAQVPAHCKTGSKNLNRVSYKLWIIIIYSLLLLLFTAINIIIIYYYYLHVIQTLLHLLTFDQSLLLHDEHLVFKQTSWLAGLLVQEQNDSSIESDTLALSTQVTKRDISPTPHDAEHCKNINYSQLRWFETSFLSLQ